MSQVEVTATFTISGTPEYVQRMLQSLKSGAASRDSAAPTLPSEMMLVYQSLRHRYEDRAQFWLMLCEQKVVYRSQIPQSHEGKGSLRGFTRPINRVVSELIRRGELSEALARPLVTVHSSTSKNWDRVQEFRLSDVWRQLKIPQYSTR